MLAEHLRAQAAWRSGKANEYDDDRNTESGLSLLDVAQHLEQLPDDDPRLARVDSAYRISEMGLLSLGFSAST
jgi:hypothetical protein